MKAIQLLILILCFSVFALSQSELKITKLTGIVFDQTGAVLAKTKVTSSDKDGKKYQSESDSEGRYELILPVGKYNIQFESSGFGIKTYQDFQVVDSVYGKMFQDVVLKGLNPEPCGYSGADCLNTTFIEPKNPQISNKIIQRRLDQLP
jgi:hypothetical protein